MVKLSRTIQLAVLVLLVAGLAGCNLPGMATPTPRIRYITWTPEPSATPAPTDTPEPTATFTAEPSPTFTLPPEPTTPPEPTAAPSVSAEDAIRVFYINKDEAGMYGCNEDLWYINTKQAKTGNLANDIRYALSIILAYHQPEIGTLYHPGYASNLSVGNVEVRADGAVIVSLSGEWVPTGDRCDGKRFTDQLRRTIKQFGDIPYIQILINGTPIADAVSRK